ncbi:MAG: hypothetical protein JWN95_4069 [Frankiales bacterium]|nr:hypothetical protein [Frankiales bacterium]
MGCYRYDTCYRDDTQAELVKLTELWELDAVFTNYYRPRPVIKNAGNARLT